ncbi:hypothetical protein E5Q_00407 [Mixia osmundae IAM 14324]|uniref:Oxysterol-binding protein n=1 Tax=Mixia osmundae (strain CBS 9802 / IAM 14324 / JCM 22182 / KY 12970) TaxID=764103 RepID=G7DTB4_MIXOS|nr:hypothetical protein E5Q_00407 [Mixia osmundae IAM 14324]
MAEDGAAVPSEHKGSWTSFLKSISTFSGDLSSMTAPSFILSPTSLAEFPSYWGEPTEAFIAISKGKTAEDRALAVLAWFLCTTKGQFTRRETQTGSEKKPLNPVLGETFLGRWDTPQGKTELIAEQVSHHPPVTAYFLHNKESRVSLQGHCGQKTSFSGRSIVVKQVGHALIRLSLPDGGIESYLITLPRLRIEGLWYGSPYIELSDSSFIQSSAGTHIAIEYKGKGYFGGKSHSFKASVAKSAKDISSPDHVIEGQWNAKSSYTKGSHSGKPFHDATKDFPEIAVAPIEEQDTMESRRIWKEVADGIRKGNFEAASAAKTKLENEQRQKRKQETELGKPWQMRYFTHVPSDADYGKLVKQFGGQPDEEEAFYYKGL